MMKFTVTTDGGVTENHAIISGDGRTLTAETVAILKAILKAIHDIDDGEILSNAFETLLEVIANDLRKG